MPDSPNSIIASSGFVRRIQLIPSAGFIRAGLEDDFHRFEMHVAHAGGVITGLDCDAVRFPWSVCPDAGRFLAEQCVGQKLGTVATFDPHIHCTHMFELLVAAARHAFDKTATQFDLWVADRIGGRTQVTMSENGQRVLTWMVEGTIITAPGKWAGLDLRQLSTWRKTLNPATAERAMLMRRVVQVSNGRAISDDAIQRALADGRRRMGGCYRYQLPQAGNAVHSLDWRRDFSNTDAEPLQGFPPAALPENSPYQ